MFSPYYAWSGRGDPANHCAINVALYGPKARWTMTERGRRAVTRTEDVFRVGPSHLAWRGDTLEIALHERGAPLPRAVRGSIRLTPEAMPATAFALDPAGRHVWQPVAPLARISVALEAPELRWEGEAYLDSNSGDEPLEDGFAAWTWARARRRRDAMVLYDVQPRRGPARSMALSLGRDGVAEVEPPPPQLLPGTLWRIPRGIRSDAAARVRQTLEDAPFYARSLVDGVWGGEPVSAVHESLALDRFATRWVKALLPFRMPRLP